MELNIEQIEESIGYIDDVLENWDMWQAHHRKLTKAMKDLISFAKKLTEENERLSEDKDYWKNRAKESESEYNQAVKRGYNLGAIDYVGSFAERLKAKTITIQDHTGKLGSVVVVDTIDQIAKEMLEGEDGKAAQ